MADQDPSPPTPNRQRSTPSASGEPPSIVNRRRRPSSTASTVPGSSSTGQSPQEPPRPSQQPPPAASNTNPVSSSARQPLPGRNAVQGGPPFLSLVEVRETEPYTFRIWGGAVYDTIEVIRRRNLDPLNLPTAAARGRIVGPPSPVSFPSVPSLQFHPVSRSLSLDINDDVRVNIEIDDIIPTMGNREITLIYDETVPANRNVRPSSSSIVNRRRRRNRNTNRNRRTQVNAFVGVSDVEAAEQRGPLILDQMTEGGDHPNLQFRPLNPDANEIQWLHNALAGLHRQRGPLISNRTTESGDQRNSDSENVSEGQPANTRVGHSGLSNESEEQQGPLILNQTTMSGDPSSSNQTNSDNESLYCDDTQN